MTAKFRSLRFWITRGVPLAGVGLLALSLVPADFAAAGKTLAIDAKPRIATTAATLPPSKKVKPVAGNYAPPAPTSQPVINPARMGVGSSWARWAELPVVSKPMSISASASVEPAGLTVDQIGPSGVNVRSDASKSSAKLFVLAPRSPVRVGARRAGWVHVYADAGSGWVYETFLRSSTAAKTPIASSPPPASPKRGLAGRILRVASSTPVRDGPDSQAHQIYDLEPGERVRIAQAIGNWALIETTDGETGWVRYR